MIGLKLLIDYFYRRTPTAALTDDSVKIPLRLAEKTEINYNTRKFRFQLPSEYHVLGLSPGQHVRLSATINGKLIIRSYTPVSDCGELGFVDIIVKIYFREVNPAFPEGGKMSQYLDGLQIGNTVDFSGPTGSILYKGSGTFLFKRKAIERRYKTLSMIAGGSGITPMLQIISTVLRNPQDTTMIKLLFANTEEKDILCRKELDSLVSKANGQLVVHYILSKAPTNWTGSKGRIDETEIRKHLFPADEDNLVLLCGPTAMINQACKPSLETLGHATENIVVF